MKLHRILMASVLALAIAGLIPLSAQTPGQSASLGDLAKKLKSERAASGKSVRVFTNDNLPRGPASGGISIVGSMSPTTPTPPAPAAGEAAAGPASTASTEESPATHDEKYYRDKMAELRSRLELHERELGILQQKQSQGEVQYYPDPNKTLQQEYSRSDINKRNDEIAKKQAQIDEDKRAMQDLQDQLRREGAPSGWLR
ncbi:MAG: hypothetical protein LAN62_03975 [Acidobacteriia bacterium]|nr:hypothetical protein [Terriglobia bacterium]